MPLRMDACTEDGCRVQMGQYRPTISLQYIGLKDAANQPQCCSACLLVGALPVNMRSPPAKPHDHPPLLAPVHSEAKELRSEDDVAR